MVRGLTVVGGENTHAKHDREEANKKNEANEKLLDWEKTLELVELGHSGSLLALLGIDNSCHWASSQLQRAQEVRATTYLDRCDS